MGAFSNGKHVSICLKLIPPPSPSYEAVRLGDQAQKIGMQALVERNHSVRAAAAV
jgi:hypothetical protein